MHTYFYQLGEKYALFPLFYPLSIIFPQTCYFAIFFPGGGGGEKQKNIHPCFAMQLLLISTEFNFLKVAHSRIFKPLCGIT